MGQHQPDTPSPALAGLVDGVRVAALEAGNLLAKYQSHIELTSIESKSSAVDLVSAADKRSEDLLRERLGQLLPSAGFIGEESPFPDLSRHELFWCVDPLDGTSNYLCGLPVWSVSIALVDAQLSPQLGVVHAPPWNRTWTGYLGGGAKCNGRAVRVRPEPPGGGLPNAMLATGFPYDVTQGGANIEYYSVMQSRFQKIRRLGSAAIDLALVAEGTYDGLWELKLAPWDAAAGLLLVREAGGAVATIDGADYVPGHPSIVAAATPQLLAHILELLRSVPV
jgi:myo-inositol-1(or 4)-monophosphatase